MPSVSQSQQRLMAACEHGAGWASCPHMTHSQLHDFAATPRKGLPDHVKMRGGGIAKLGNVPPLPKAQYGKDIIPAALTPEEMVLTGKQQKAVMPIPGKEKLLKPGQLAALTGKRPKNWASAPKLKFTGGRIRAQEGLSPKMFPDMFGYPDQPWDRGPGVRVGRSMAERMNESNAPNPEAFRFLDNFMQRWNGYGFMPGNGFAAFGPTQIPTNWVQYPGVGNVPMAVPFNGTPFNPPGQPGSVAAPTGLLPEVK